MTSLDERLSAAKKVLAEAEEELERVSAEIASDLTAAKAEAAATERVFASAAMQLEQISAAATIRLGLTDEAVKAAVLEWAGVSAAEEERLNIRGTNKVFLEACEVHRKRVLQQDAEVVAAQACVRQLRQERRLSNEKVTHVEKAFWVVKKRIQGAATEVTNVVELIVARDGRKKAPCAENRLSAADQKRFVEARRRISEIAEQKYDDPTFIVVKPPAPINPPFVWPPEKK